LRARSCDTSESANFRARRIELQPPGGTPLHVDDELAEERSAIALEVDGGLHVLVPATS
jgi:hypothetical protein